MPGATPQAINEVATNVIEKEKRFLPGPRKRADWEFDALRIKREFVTPKPNLRHEGARHDQLVKGANSKEQTYELTRVVQGKIKVNDPTLSVSAHFKRDDGGISYGGRTRIMCGHLAEIVSRR